MELDRPGKAFAKPMQVTIPAGYSGTDFEIPHTMRHIPSDAIWGGLNASANIWRGSKDWTRTAIYLRSSAEVTFTLYLVP